MKRVLVVALVGGFAAAFAVAGFPALAADQSVDALTPSNWSNEAVEISLNDTVTWNNATGVNHSLCVQKPGTTGSTCDEYSVSTAPNWTGAHQFTTDNATYTFFCTVHPSSMRGTVKVGNGSPTTTTGTTPTTTSGTDTTPTTTTTETAPTTTTTTSTSPALVIEPPPPRFVGTIKRKSSRRVLKLTFKVSRDARLTATLRRRPPGMKSFAFVSKTTKAVTAGSNTVSLLRAGRKLRAGAYKLTLVLKDSEGRSPAPKVLNFKLT